MSQPIRIAIVEDDAGLRETLQQVFGAAPDFKVVGTFGDGESAARQLPGKTPDVVLMDINLPGMSGIDCLRQLKAGMPRVRVIMVTVYDDNDNLFQSLVAGADGYLLKRATRLRLLDSVREIVGGGAPISPSVARRMVEYFHHLNDPASPKPAQAAALLALFTRKNVIPAAAGNSAPLRQAPLRLTASLFAFCLHITCVRNLL